MDVKDEFQWSDEDMPLHKFHEKYGQSLPVVLMITTGYYDEYNVNDISADEVYFVYGMIRQKRIIAKSEDERYVSIPYNYRLKFQTLTSRTGPPSDPMTLDDMLIHGASGQLIRLETDDTVMFEFSADRSGTSKLGHLEVLDTYEERYFIARPLLEGKTLDQTVIGVPVYLPITLRVADGFKPRTQESFSSWMQKSSELLKSVDDGNNNISVTCREILVFDHQPSGNYAYINPSKYARLNDNGSANKVQIDDRMRQIPTPDAADVTSGINDQHKLRQRPASASNQLHGTPRQPPVSSQRPPVTSCSSSSRLHGDQHAPAPPPHRSTKSGKVSPNTPASCTSPLTRPVPPAPSDRQKPTSKPADNVATVSEIYELAGPDGQVNKTISVAPASRPSDDRARQITRADSDDESCIYEQIVDVPTQQNQPVTHQTKQPPASKQPPGTSSKQPPVASPRQPPVVPKQPSVTSPPCQRTNSLSDDNKNSPESTNRPAKERPRLFSQTPFSYTAPLNDKDSNKPLGRPSALTGSDEAKTSCSTSSRSNGDQQTSAPPPHSKKVSPNTPASCTSPLARPVPPASSDRQKPTSKPADNVATVSEIYELAGPDGQANKTISVAPASRPSDDRARQITRADSDDDSDPYEQIVDVPTQQNPPVTHQTKQPLASKQSPGTSSKQLPVASPRQPPVVPKQPSVTSPKQPDLAPPCQRSNSLADDNQNTPDSTDPPAKERAKLLCQTPFNNAVPQEEKDSNKPLGRPTAMTESDVDTKTSCSNSSRPSGAASPLLNRPATQNRNALSAKLSAPVMRVVPVSQSPSTPPGTQQKKRPRTTCGDEIRWIRPEDVPTDIENFSVNQIALCLEMLSMVDLATEFRKQLVDGQMLLQAITEDVLVKDFGCKVFDAKKLVMFAKGWRPKNKDAG